MTFIQFFTATLRGLGQIMLQGNAITGLLFLVGLATHSITIALAALLGAMTGTVLTTLMKSTPSLEISEGIHGFNPALVAIAAVYFYGATSFALIAGLLGCLLCVLLMRLLPQIGIKPYTFPFVVTTWGMLLIQTPTPSPPGMALTPWIWLDGFFQSFGQVMFQADTLVGGIFFIGLLMHSRRCALFAASGAALAMGIDAAFHVEPSQIVAGIHGYNAVLAAIAVSLLTKGRMLPLVVALMAALITIACTWLMQALQLPALTFPFILATWLALAFLSWRRAKHPLADL